MNSKVECWIFCWLFEFEDPDFGSIFTLTKWADVRQNAKSPPRDSGRLVLIKWMRGQWAVRVTSPSRREMKVHARINSHHSLWRCILPAYNSINMLITSHTALCAASTSTRAATSDEILLCVGGDSSRCMRQGYATGATRAHGAMHRLRFARR